MGSKKKILNEDERKVYLTIFYQIDKLFNNNILTEDEKIYSLLTLYSTVKRFEYDYYYYLDKCGTYDGVDKDLEIINNIYNKIKEYEQKKLISNMQYIISIKDKLNNYNYAEFIITSYIESDISYIQNEFFKFMDINEDVFNYCLKLIKDINPNLYHKYEEIKKQNVEKKFNENIKALKEIVLGIKTGYLSDGKEFDILQFWRLVPFKYFHGLQMELHEYRKYVTNKLPLTPGSTLQYNISRFMYGVMPDDEDIVLTYMKKNKINKFSYTSLEERIKSENQILEKKRILPNGQVINSKLNVKDIEIIFNYMKHHQLPLLSEVYIILKEKYLNGEDLFVPYENIQIIDKVKIDPSLLKQKENVMELAKPKRRIRKN